ncbi:MAG: cellulase family glycosylhydrolase [Clostridia bacterium]|nr:cellulase family glycosylhydrolase [Clostridia bacterium]
MENSNNDNCRKAGIINKIMPHGRLLKRIALITAGALVLTFMTAGIAGASSGNRGLLVNFRAGDSWSSGGLTYTKWDVSLLNNTDSGIGSWNFSVPVKVSGVENCWNCNISQNGSGLTFSSADYNGNIGAGAELTGPGCILRTSGPAGILAGTWLVGASGGTAVYLGSGSTSDYGPASGGAGQPGSQAGAGTGTAGTSALGQTGSQAAAGQAGTTSADSHKLTVSQAATIIINNIPLKPEAKAQLMVTLERVRTVSVRPLADFELWMIVNLKKSLALAGFGKTSGSTGTNDPGAPAGAASGTPLAVHGALSVSGTQLVDSKGQPFRLKGVSTHGIAWFPDYVNRDAFRTLRDDWGANLVRLAMYSAEYNGYCSGGDRAKLKGLIDTGVKAATDLGMYVIIDWHILSDGDPNIHKAEAKEFFGEMAAKYAGYDNVLYEICNEPNGCSWSSVRAYAEEVIPVIRAQDPDAIIIVGTPTWSQDVEQVAANPVSRGANVMYTLHFYAATHGDNIRNKARQALAAGTPLFVTEFSICDASGNGGIDYNSAAAWKKLMDSYGLSFAGWSLSNKAETSALISSGCGKTSGWSTSELSETGRWLRDLCRAS